MSYRLRDGLSYCVSDGIAIFLDVDDDRYFRLPASLERAFLEFTENQACTEKLRLLLERRILVPSADGETAHAPAPAPSPTRSAVELKSTPTGSAAALIPETMLIAWFLHRQIRTQPLKVVLEASSKNRQAQLDIGRLPLRPEGWLLETTARFRRARLHVPIPTRCLLDSLTLAQVLARRGQDSKIVFGVSPEPFSAHCWVQVGDLVLNETVGNVMTHTPIKVI